MTQRIRPAQAYPAVSAPIAAVASSGAHDQRNFHKRICDLIGPRKGTTQYGTLKITNTTQRPILIPDAVYTSLIGAGLDVSDALYNSTSAEATETNTSEIPVLWNPGYHRQVILCVGDSITNSAVGAGTYPALDTITNKVWAQAVAQNESELPGLYLTNTITNAPDRASTYRWHAEKSRLVFNFGRDSGRLANQSGFTYTIGTPFLDNIEQLSNLVLHTGQQLVIQIFCGTNDVKHADDNSNPGLAAVPTGSAGYSETGSTNYFEDALTPFITAIKLKYPTAKILFVSPIARSTSDAAGSLNAKFVEIARYAVENQVALNIDRILDARDVAELSPVSGSTQTANTTYYQADRVHLMVAANLILGAELLTHYDALLGV